MAVNEYLAENADDIDELLMHVEVEIPKTGKLSGKNFCFTGAQNSGKSFWIGLVEANGGNIKSSVSKKLDYLIVGDSPGSKLQKAQELKKNGCPIEIIDVVELQKILDG